MQKSDQKIIIVRRETRLAGLKRRFATVGQAAFVLAGSQQQERLRSSGGSAKMAPRKQAEDEALVDYRREDDTYRGAVDRLYKELSPLLPVQLLDRDMLPTYLFGPHDVVVTVGPDGLVANTAKYALGLPIVAVNPDPARIDGVLLPFNTQDATSAVRRALDGKARSKAVTLAEAILGDGQRLLAFNDLFIGARSHVSARYRVTLAGKTEPHSSSGVIVSTGAGSTGWLSSVMNMAGAVSQLFTSAPPPPPLRLAWDDPRLVYVVREPFVSKASAATLASGLLERGTELIFESQMSDNGVIFSDGIEADALAFESGTIARVRVAQEKALLVI